MNIIHFAKILPTSSHSNTLRVGGSETSVVTLAKAQSKNHNVAIINSEKIDGINLNNKNVKLINIKFISINIIFNNPLKIFIKSFGKPDVIIIHEIYNINIVPLVLFSRLMNINVYVCPRGALSPVALSIRKFKKYLYHKIVFNNILKFIKGFIALNRGEKNIIKKLYKTHKIFIIPNGIIRVCSFFAQKNKQIIKKKIKKKEILIGYLGRYDFYIKGLDILLREYSLYLRRSSKKLIRLIFIGEHRKNHGYSSKLIINNFNNLHNKNPIITSGPFFKNKKYRELLKFDILIQPSRSEGMPNTVLEAMSVGIPIAATKETNILDILKKSNSGWEINHKLNNISNFLLKIENINKKKIFNYGLRGYKYSLKNLHIQKITDYCFKKNEIRSYKS